MTTTTLQDTINTLLDPVSGGDPAGEWLRYSDLWDQIQEARRADDPNLPQGIWQLEIKKADWKRVAALSETALQQSKDLYVAAWLVEAWVHLYGPAGGAAGFRFLHDLSEKFWDDLYPRIDPDDPEVRAAPFDWLNDKLPLALGSVQVTQPDSPDTKPQSWLQCVAARREATSGREGSETMDGVRFQTSLSLTPVAWLRDLKAQIDSAVVAVQELIGLLQRLAPEGAPSLARILNTLIEMQRWSASVTAERPGEPLAPAAATADGAAPQPEPQPDGEMSQPSLENGVRSREEAYRMLSVAADYLLRTEPHSPTPYLVRRAVNWGNMPLAELVEEFSQDGNDLRMLRVLLGLVEDEP